MKLPPRQNIPTSQDAADKATLTSNLDPTASSSGQGIESLLKIIVTGPEGSSDSELDDRSSSFGHTKQVGVRASSGELVDAMEEIYLSQEDQGDDYWYTDNPNRSPPARISGRADAKAVADETTDDEDSPSMHVVDG